MYGRGLARNLISWIDCNYDIFSILNPKCPVNFEQHFAGRYLLQQARAILHYKQQAEMLKLPGLVNCTAKDVEMQMHRLFSKGMDVYGKLDLKEDMSWFSSLAFDSTDLWTVSRKATPHTFKGILNLSSYDIITNHFTCRTGSIEVGQNVG